MQIDKEEQARIAIEKGHYEAGLIDKRTTFQSKIQPLSDFLGMDSADLVIERIHHGRIMIDMKEEDALYLAYLIKTAESEDAAGRSAAIPLIAADVFLAHVLPYFTERNITIRYHLEKNNNGAVAITGLIANDGSAYPPHLRALKVREAMPYDTPEERTRDEHFVHGVANGDVKKSEMLEFVPGSSEHKPENDLAEKPKSKDWSDVFDYAEILKDPNNVANLQQYGIWDLRIHRDVLTAVVKALFESRKWVYGGNHYGGGLISLQTVIGYENNIVPIHEVVAVLDQAGVKYEIEKGEEGESAEEEAKPDDYPRSAITLGEDDKLELFSVYTPESPQMLVVLKIGGNDVNVICLREQYSHFLSAFEYEYQSLVLHEVQRTDKSIEETEEHEEIPTGTPQS